METYFKNILSNEHHYLRLLIRFCATLQRIVKSWWRLVLTILLILISIYTWKHPQMFLKEPYMFFEELAVRIIMILCDATIIVTLVLLWGYSYSDYIFTKAFLRAGITNSAGETPILKKINKTGSQYELYFFSAGMPLENWNDKIELLNNVLKMTISDVKIGRNNQEIIIRGIRGLYNWNEEKMYYPIGKENENVIILGENSSGIVSCNLSIYPHLLIGGSTGSGKTYLLKFIIFQLFAKKHQVIIADLKGGIDYSRTYKEKCELILDENMW